MEMSFEFKHFVFLTALGLIITEKPPSFADPKLAAMLIYCIAIFLCFFAGARSSMIGITVALLVLYLDSKEKIIKFILFSLIGAVLLSLLVSVFYLETLRPILFHGDPHSGFNRTLLSLDIFYIGEVETKRTLYSIMDRLHLWRDGIRIAFEHPFGTGFGGYEKYTVSGIEISPHNVPLELIVEMGFLIATVYLALMALIFVASPRSILPYMVYLTIFFLFSGNFVDARQLLFFAAIALQFQTSSTQTKDMASPPGSTQQV